MATDYKQFGCGCVRFVRNGVLDEWKVTCPVHWLAMATGMARRVFPAVPARNSSQD